MSYLFFVDDLILFSEAKDEQLLCIKESLEAFSKSSGQKVNYSKHPCFAQTTSHIRGGESQCMHRHAINEEAGEVLGSPYAKQERNGDAPKEVVECVCSKLDGWKVRCLSRADKITLVQSVLTGIPIFQMQLEKLPCWVHKAPDRATRGCVWGEAGEKRGMHLTEVGDFD